MAGNILQEWVASGTFTCTLTGLATSATRVVGRESTVLSLTSDDPLGLLVAGKITVGTSPTGGFIDIWAYGQLADTPVYPVLITGSDAAVTFASENQRNAALRLIASIACDTTSDRTYTFGPVDVASLFGGSLPKGVGIFVSHSTGVNLNATAANQALYYSATYARYT